MAYTSSFVLIVLFCGIYLNIVGCSVAKKSGPFTSTLVRLEKCANPTHPYQKYLPAELSLELYKMGKRTLIRGNYTSYKPDSGLKMGVKEYFLVNDQWKPTFFIPGMSCRGRIGAMLADIFRVKFNKKTCAVPKGVYFFNNIDYDFLDHVFFTDQNYGKVLWKFEAFSKKGTTFCYELEAVVTPKNKYLSENN